jgi:hypothetical protein
MVTEIEVPIESRGSGNNQIFIFEDEPLLFDNEEVTMCKEAVMGPDSVKWLEEIKSVIISYTRNQVSEVGRPSRRREAY